MGRPKVGREVSLEDPQIVDLKAVPILLRHADVREIVPVGSPGEYIMRPVIWPVNTGCK